MKKKSGSEKPIKLQSTTLQNLGKIWLRKQCIPEHNRIRYSTINKSKTQTIKACPQVGNIYLYCYKRRKSLWYIFNFTTIRQIHSTISVYLQLHKFSNLGCRWQHWLSIASVKGKKGLTVSSVLIILQVELFENQCSNLYFHLPSFLQEPQWKCGHCHRNCL